jgi:hypothetical protein
MERKYVIKLKGIDCYLKSTSKSKSSSNFTFDHTKAKVFTESKKMDFVGKLILGEYKPGDKGCKTDFIRLTMDKRTWQEMYDDNFEQWQMLSDNRMRIHQFSFSLADELATKVKTFSRSEEFPNFDCQFYGEDFERKYL